MCPLHWPWTSRLNVIAKTFEKNKDTSCNVCIYCLVWYIVVQCNWHSYIFKCDLSVQILAPLAAVYFIYEMLQCLSSKFGCWELREQVGRRADECKLIGQLKRHLWHLSPLSSKLWLKRGRHFKMTFPAIKLRKIRLGSGESKAVFSGWCENLLLRR